MATILELIANHNDQIRAKTAPGSISRIDHAGIEDALANEIRDRGMLESATTGGLASISKDNTRKVLVKDVGIFQILTSGGSPDGTTTFASADVGFLWQKVISNTVSVADPETITTDADYDYEIASGLMVDMIGVKPSNAPTLKIGTTDGGEQVLLSTLLTANKWNWIRQVVDADGSIVTLYFVGLSASTEIVIYKRALP